MNRRDVVWLVAESLGVSVDEAEDFLNDDRGCGTSIGGQNFWLSGSMFSDIIEDILDKIGQGK